MTNYSGYIPRDLAKELLSFGMPLHKYDIDLYDYDGKPYFYTEEEEIPGQASYDRYRIPTYGEAAIDQMMESVVDLFRVKDKEERQRMKELISGYTIMPIDKEE